MLTIHEAKKIPLTQILAALGRQPVQASVGAKDWWYFSPFRHENQASFHVNVEKNVWFDFGLGSGGDTLQFAQLYFKCDEQNALNHLSDLQNKSLREQLPGEKKSSPQSTKNTESFVLTEVRPQLSATLLHYLTNEHFIRHQTAERFLKEVHFVHKISGKHYYAAGMPNVAGGWEVCNPMMKTSVGKKDLTFMRGHAPTISIFEGTMDFLSAYDYYGSILLEGDTVVLHSMAFVEKVSSMVAQNGKYERIYTYFDNYETGRHADQHFVQRFGALVEPCFGLYYPCKDFNEWWIRKRR